MAKVILNTALTGISGTIGDCVFRRHRGGSVLQRKSSRRRLWTARQRVTHSIFSRGSAFAAAVKADPALRQLYTSCGRRRRLNYRQMAIRDYFHAPEINKLTSCGYSPTAGGPIAVIACDDFAVVRVMVAVRDADGAVLAFGDATLRGDWEYRVPPPAPGANPAASVQVTAFDRPGNFHTRSFPLPGG